VHAPDLESPREALPPEHEADPALEVSDQGAPAALDEEALPELRAPLTHPELAAHGRPEPPAEGLLGLQLDPVVHQIVLRPVEKE
jgi:hypothetical protein